MKCTIQCSTISYVRGFKLRRKSGKVYSIVSVHRFTAQEKTFKSWLLSVRYETRKKNMTRDIQVIAYHGGVLNGRKGCAQVSEK